VTDQINVLGGALALCSTDPVTGWTRNGCCEGHDGDTGVHTVCAVMTEEFLAFSRAAGNDLSTPRPEYGFAGLAEGDRWCLCAERWEEARLNGFAPLVILEATSIATLAHTDLGHLQAHGWEEDLV